MAWPAPQDYNEALQNLSATLADTELRLGAAALGTLGLPKAVTGQFATVYRVSTAGGDWAVRCFLRDIPDQRERYRAISAYLAQARLPEAVDFEFVPRGIRVGGTWYPILKMDWVDGTTLDAFIERNLGNRQVLGRLADAFTSLVTNLRERDMAHGDLQHGNVLVVEQGDGISLRLVDYDGMWVPSLQGKASHEIGHPNYQHPARTLADFGAQLDTFSAWSILTSLLSLSAEPALWSRVRVGDEQLLFHKSDYVEPWNSRAMSAVKELVSAAVSELGYELATYALEPSVREIPFPPQINSGVIGSPSEESGVGEEWWRGAPEPQPLTNAGEVPWWLPVPEPVFFGGPAWQERLLALAGVLVLLALIPASWMIPPILSLGLAGMCVLTVALGLLMSYRELPEVRAKREVALGLAAARASLAEARMVSTNLARQLSGEVEQQRNQIAALDKQLHATKASELASVKKIEQALGAKVNGLRAKQTTLKEAEDAEVAETLASLRAGQLKAQLARVSVNASTIPGIGEALTQRLAESGIRNAADFTGVSVAYFWSGPYQRLDVGLKLSAGVVVHVDGIGQAKARALDEWRKASVTRLSRSLPTRLSESVESAIRTRYAHDRLQAKREEQGHSQFLALEVKRLREQSEKKHRGIRADVARLEGQVRQRVRATDEPRRKAEETVRSRRMEVARMEARLSSYSAISFAIYLLQLVQT